MTVTKDAKARLLANYAKETHFLQNCHMPRRRLSGSPFVYVKMHKAASSTVIATLATHLAAEAQLADPQIEMKSLHKSPGEMFLLGRRVGTQGILDRFSDPNQFCFTLIRDPYRRVVSAWADKISEGGAHFKTLRRTIGRMSRAHMPLREFLDVLANSPEAVDADRHWRPQVKEGAFDTLSYDFVGDVGRLQSSLAVITQQVFGTSIPMIADTRESLGHATNSRQLIANLSAADKRKIEAIYEEDLALYERVTRRLDQDLKAA